MSVEHLFLEPRCLCGDCLNFECTRNVLYKKPYVGDERYQKMKEAYLDEHENGGEEKR